VYGTVGCIIATSLTLMVLSAGYIGYHVQYVNATVFQTNNSFIIYEMIQNGNALFHTSENNKAMTTFDQVLKFDSRSVDALNGKVWSSIILENIKKRFLGLIWH
jgi:hypothetical protein